MSVPRAESGHPTSLACHSGWSSEAHRQRSHPPPPSRCTRSPRRSSSAVAHACAVGSRRSGSGHHADSARSNWRQAPRPGRVSPMEKPGPVFRSPRRSAPGRPARAEVGLPRARVVRDPRSQRMMRRRSRILNPPASHRRGMHGIRQASWRFPGYSVRMSRTASSMGREGPCRVSPCRDESAPEASAANTPEGTGWPHRGCTTDPCCSGRLDARAARTGLGSVRRPLC